MSSIESKSFNEKQKQSSASRSLIIGVAVFGLMGISRGLDEGTVSGSIAQKSFQVQFGLDDRPPAEVASIKSNIATVVLMGSIAGSILGLLVNDVIGRVRSLQLSFVLWIIGVVIQITTFGGVGQLYAGRLIAGLGIGMTPVVCPTYLVEVSPKQIRGRCSNIFAGSVYLGIMLGYFANWGTSEHISDEERNQWVIPITIQIMVGGIGFISSFFVIESPRWLLKQGRDREGVENLMRLRNADRDDSRLAQELGQIYSQVNEELAIHSKWKVVKHILCDGGQRYRLILGLLIQLLGQWSGATAVTVYAPEIFQIVGVEHEKRLFATSMFGVVKFIAALSCALFVIDYFGRKKALYSGIFLQVVSSLYLAVYLSFREQYDNDAITKAGIPAIIMVYLSGIGWALGWNSVQYLFGPEIFPTALRSVASGFIIVFHFVNQYSCSKAMPRLFLVFHPWGTMAFYSAVSFIGILFCYFMLPEVSGTSLEHIGNLFVLPWYKIGRASRKTHGSTTVFVDKHD